MKTTLRTTVTVGPHWPHREVGGVAQRRQATSIGVNAVPPTPEDFREAYGFAVREFRRHPFGFESECWIADDVWFVKVWRHDGPRNLGLPEQLDLPVPVPLRTMEGQLEARSGGRAFAVFPFIPGRSATWNDWAELATVMRRI